MEIIKNVFGGGLDNTTLTAHTKKILTKRLKKIRYMEIFWMSFKTTIYSL